VFDVGRQSLKVLRLGVVFVQLLQLCLKYK